MVWRTQTILRIEEDIVYCIVLYRNVFANTLGWTVKSYSKNHLLEYWYLFILIIFAPPTIIMSQNVLVLYYEIYCASFLFLKIHSCRRRIPKYLMKFVWSIGYLSQDEWDTTQSCLALSRQIQCQIFSLSVLASFLFNPKLCRQHSQQFIWVMKILKMQCFF